MRAVIDRFEGELAVVELNEEMFNIPRALLADAREGDIIEITVLPREGIAQEEPASLFERLRRKRKRR